MEENNILSLESVHLTSDKPKSNYLCENFRIFPNDKEKSGGYLFGIIELNATPIPEAEKIHQTIVNTLKESYYQQIITSPAPQKLNIESVFEFALNKTNTRLVELIQIGQIKLILENLNYFIGVCRPSEDQSQCELVFANRGPINAQLIHQINRDNFKIINILKDTGVPSSADLNDRIKIFSSITSGALALHDSMVISTDIFNNFFSAPKILYILTNHPLAHALDYFRSQVKIVKEDAAIAYSAIILHFDHNTATADQPISQKSINQLMSTAATTEKLLAPSFALNIKKHISTGLRIITAFFRPSDKMQLATWQKLFIIFKRLPQFISGLPRSIKKLIGNISAIITGKKKLSPVSVLAKIKHFTVALRDKNSQRRLILVGIIGLVIILSFSLYGIKQQRANKLEAQQYASALSKIRNSIAEAESDYIIKNKNRSLSELEQASKDLVYLPQASEIQKINFNDLQKQINDLRNKLLNIEKIVPQFVIELRADNNPIKANRLLIDNNTLLAYGTDNYLSLINLPENKITATNKIDSSITSIAGENNDYWMINSSNQAIHYKNGTMSAATTIASSADTLGLYNGNLYILNKSNQTINRYKPTGDDLGSPQNWIKNLKNANITTATSLTIDGNIYILNENGQILKFFGGEIADFQASPIDPPATSASRIITNKDNTNLYVFDRHSKRLVILSKDGQLIKQYVFDSMSSIDDLLVNNRGTEGYLLSEGKIYKFSIQ